MNLFETLKGKYHSCPDGVMSITSPEAFLVFSFIIRHANESFPTKIIEISKASLMGLTGFGDEKLKRILCELETLDLVKSTCSPGDVTGFIINWEEVCAVSDFAYSVNYNGRAALRKLCAQKGKPVAFSKIEGGVIEETREVYKFTFKPTSNNSENEGGSEKTREVETEIPLNLPRFDQNSIKTREVGAENCKNEGGCEQFSLKTREVICSPTSHFIEKRDGKYIMNVILSNAESIVAEDHELEVRFISKNEGGGGGTSHVFGGTSHVFGGTSHVFGGTSHVLPPNLPRFDEKSPKTRDSIYNNINNINNINTERSEVLNIRGEENKTGEEDVLFEKNQNTSFENLPDSSISSSHLSSSDFNKIFDKAEEDKKAKEILDKEKSQEFLLKYFLNLKQSKADFQFYEKFEFDSIIREPDLHQSPVEVFIQEVWAAIKDTVESSIDNLDENGNLPEIEINGYEFDAYSFIKNIFKRVYSDMLEENETTGNFNLKEWEAASILDFEFKTNKDGEKVFVIDQSRIRNINAKINKPKKLALSSFQLRRLNIDYMDNLVKIAEPIQYDEKKLKRSLSQMDIAMWRLRGEMLAWMKEQGKTSIHKIFFSEFVNDSIAGLKEVTKEDLIKCLNLKEGNYKSYDYREDFIIAEKIKAWNEEHEQDSSVEYKTWNDLSGRI